MASPHRHRSRRSTRTTAKSAAVVTLSAFTLVGLPTTASYATTTTFDALIGTWRGEGKVVFTSGKSERLVCNTYYRAKETGKRISIVIRCANPSSGKIEMRGILENADGSLSGTWEERTYNATGTAKGGITGNQIHLSFEGPVNGTLTTLMWQDTQSIFIRSRGSTLSTVNIMLKRQSTQPAQPNTSTTSR